MGNYDPLSSLSLTKYDPIHAALVKRKKILDGDDVELPQKTEYKNEDVKALEDFCKRYGILATHFGNIPPTAALRMLKAKMGVIESPVTETQTNKKSLLLG